MARLGSRRSPDIHSAASRKIRTEIRVIVLSFTRLRSVTSLRADLARVNPTPAKAPPAQSRPRLPLYTAPLKGENEER